MRTPIRSRAIELFRGFGVTAKTYEEFDASALPRIASDVIAVLRSEYGAAEVIDFVNASYSSGGIASMLAVGPTARAHKRARKG